jgi:hypothetical protein
MYMPRPTAWLYGGHRFQLNSETQLYDQPEALSAYLAFLRHWNAVYLQTERPLSQTYQWGSDANKKSVGSLQALLDLGAAESRYAVVAYRALWSELSHLKTVVMMDNLNEVFGVSKYNDAESRPITGDKLSVFKPVVDWVQDPARVPEGVKMVLASTQQPFRLQTQTPDQMAELKYAKMETMEVPPLSLEETQALLHYYAQCRLIQQGDVEPEFVKKIQMVSGGRSAEVFDYCASKAFI